jgi:ATPase subunit of ABC transporter with duplicated ATPase domains
VAAAAVIARDLVLAHGRDVAVASASFEIPAGQVTALIGPNGAGKSTLLHALAGVLHPSRGSLTVAARSRRGGVGYVLQATQAAAYGGRALRVGGGTLLLDDPHHHATHARDGHTGPLGHHAH